MQNPTNDYFPWSKHVKRHRDIIKHDLPSISKTVKDNGSIAELANSSTTLPTDQALLCPDNTIFSELNLSVNQQNIDLDNKENKLRTGMNRLAQNFKPNNLTVMHDSCNQEADRLKEEVKLLQ